MAQQSSASGYSLMQMNLCLSGFAGCYGKVAYPAGVREALVRIREARPDAVTLNETCRRDVAGLARQAGYHLRFSTRDGIDVCTAHLAQRTPAAAAVNDAQCAELASVLSRRGRTVIFGGDVNRTGGCAPGGAWTRTDCAADQAPGLQGVYGTGALGSPTAQVLPARHTDHDVLLVRTMSTTTADAGHERLNAER